MSRPNRTKQKTWRVLGSFSSQAGDKHWVANIRPDRVDIILQPANAPNPESGDVWNKFGTLTEKSRENYSNLAIFSLTWFGHKSPSGRWHYFSPLPR